jgi:hypothetical protein
MTNEEDNKFMMSDDENIPEMVKLHRTLTHAQIWD